MFNPAKLSQFSFRFVVGNLLLVIGVAALRPVFATQEATQQQTPEPEVELPPPADPAAVDPLPPALPPSENAVLVDPIGGPAIPPSAAGSTPAPINPMVLDEIRKVIQNSRGELDVPPLSYPALPLGAGRRSTQGNLEELAHRLKSIASVTQSAQALIKEAQYLQAKGQANAAQELIEQVQTLRSILVQLAADSSQAVPAPSSYSPNSGSPNSGSPTSNTAY